MCGGGLGKLISAATDMVGLTDTKGASKGFDAEAADAAAKNQAQLDANAATAERRKRNASTVLASATDNQKKKTTLGG
ncbi:hypothetical protein [Acinetobacter baumannii]|uniref:hypothetical protein n=1 Tax=Acinetobacter baumannii TaxID=470 RepID=UPI003D9B55D3